MLERLYRRKVPPTVVVTPELARTLSEASRAVRRQVGLLLVHTHLRGEPLTRDDLTDLSVLRLDLIAAIEALPDGLPGKVEIAHLVAENPEGRQWTIATWRSIHDVDLDPAWLVGTIE